MRAACSLVFLIYTPNDRKYFISDVGVFLKFHCCTNNHHHKCCYIGIIYRKYTIDSQLTDDKAEKSFGSV